MRGEVDRPSQPDRDDVVLLHAVLGQAVRDGCDIRG
jgi:hypothetical protein